MSTIKMVLRRGCTSPFSIWLAHCWKLLVSLTPTGSSPCKLPATSETECQTASYKGNLPCISRQEYNQTSHIWGYGVHPVGTKGKSRPRHRSAQQPSWQIKRSTAHLLGTQMNMLKEPTKFSPILAKSHIHTTWTLMSIHYSRSATSQRWKQICKDMIHTCTQQ